MQDYKEIARQSRIKCLELVYKAQTSHFGSLMSCADIMAVLFEKIDLNKDKFILSAGWKACVLYYHLWRKGRISEKDLNSFCMPGSKFIGLTEPIIPEILFAGGSIGMGFPAATGFALAEKIKKNGKVFVLMSDGEMQCGTTWESALVAAQHKLDNLTVIVDFNKLQAMGRVEEILNINPLKEKWESFGWQAQVINGHNFEEIEKAINDSMSSEKPAIIIAETIKGKGISFMENENIYHYKPPSDEEYKKAIKELNV